jgi:hypothetical protein
MNQSNFRSILQRFAAVCFVIVPSVGFASLPAQDPSASAPAPEASALAELGSESEVIGEAAESLEAAACECPGGIDCNGNRFTGFCGQVACGADFRTWQCRAGSWQQFGSSGCTC